MMPHIFEGIRYSFKKSIVLPNGFYFEIKPHFLERMLHWFQRDAGLFEGGVPRSDTTFSARNPVLKKKTFEIGLKFTGTCCPL